MALGVKCARREAMGVVLGQVHHHELPPVAGLFGVLQVVDEERHLIRDRAPSFIMTSSHPLLKWP